MNLYEALFVRKSVREFDMTPLDEKTLSNIRHYIEVLKPVKSSISYEIKIVDALEAKDKFKGIFQVKAPYYLVLSSELKQDYLTNAGYLIQQMVLYLTAKNIGTCYQGSLRLAKAHSLDLKYEYVIAVAFGKSQKSIYRSSDKAKRLRESELVVYKEEVSENMKTIIKAAILSPSSMNNQPWRFVVYHNRIHIFCKKTRFFTTIVNDSKLIDIGICLENIYEAADELWMGVSYVKSDSISSMELKNTEYVISVLLTEKVF